MLVPLSLTEGVTFRENDRSNQRKMRISLYRDENIMKNDPYSQGFRFKYPLTCTLSPKIADNGCLKHTLTLRHRPDFITAVVFWVESWTPDVSLNGFMFLPIKGKQQRLATLVKWSWCHINYTQAAMSALHFKHYPGWMWNTRSHILLFLSPQMD